MIKNDREEKLMLYIFSGLPGTGKTTLSQKLAQHTTATYLRIDTIEQALRELCSVKVEGEGYRLAYRIVTDNLNLGISVVADSCNPINLTRNEWEEIARNSHSKFINIEIICSDNEEHKKRIENRKATIPNFKLPLWEDVKAREYHPWVGKSCIVIDTAFKTTNESFSELLSNLGLD
jgi:predicted kinase